MKHRGKYLTVSEKIVVMKELISNKKQYDQLIETRMQDITVGIKDRLMDAQEFCALEKALNNKGILLRRKLGITTDGEAMWCPECGKFFTPPSSSEGHRNTVKPDFYGCREHRNRQEVKI